MTVEDAIAAADAILPGTTAPEGDTDPRWQAVIAVAEFIETDPEAVWQFALRWGSYDDKDLQTAIGTCGTAWSARGLVAVQLPESDDATTEMRLAKKSHSTGAAEPPAAMATYQAL